MSHTPGPWNNQENYASEDAGELAREAIRKALGQ